MTNHVKLEWLYRIFDIPPRTYQEAEYRLKEGVK